ncbi:hypothetical protein [Alloscardovia macacae]|uniref:Siphovirus ReqiPepy6 Gp37-like protein n=1 Tax=Alloscardovia macacae TaxID=1160091 RepID=A0A261F4R4_9BIFI|nr:hypothetical protein [Alloscardovia macacae]OZG54127.1 Siphovirus ReqiPepy6 Gp37-like protein [Alloscardovia macacae]
MVDIVLLRDGKAYAVEADATFDLAYGSGENDFELSLPSSYQSLVKAGDWWMIDGSAYGGIIDTITSTSDSGSTSVTWKGRSWAGVLQGKILQPSTGVDYVTYRGTAAGLLETVIRSYGLTSLFTVSQSSATTSMIVQFDRYTNAYDGLMKVLAPYGLRLDFSCRDDIVYLSCEPVKRITDANGDNLELPVKSSLETRRTNHLIGLGKGELHDRVVVHYYADAAGRVSTTQSLFGIDEVTDTYDYSNAERDELLQKTREELEERQKGNGSVEVTLPESEGWDIGDQVTAFDPVTGLTVTSAITKTIVKLSRGNLTVSYEVGKVSESSGGRSESSGGSGSGGIVYSAGDGIRITNNTIIADVTQSELDSVSSKASQAMSYASSASNEVGTLRDGIESYVKDLSISGRTLTATLGNGSRRSVTTQDTTYSRVSTSSDGLTPRLSGSTGQYLRADGSWSTPPDTRYALPRASQYTLGGVKVDNSTITISSDGTISARQSGSSGGGSFLTAWPVGSLYHSTSSTNPGSRYGGQWVQRPTLEGYLWERLS